MARNRQRAKQRQAERRARRLEQGRDTPVTDPRAAEPAPGIDPDLAVGAPPQDEGRSDLVLADEPPLDDDEHLTEGEVLEELDEEQDAGYAPVGRRGAEAAPERKHRSRVVQFLIACWAELQRVQWPNRQALTTLTGVVLGFVLIAGGYLGLLDAIVSRIVNAIL
jgi:preprotein translocase subunit SecE